jgi:molybdopterin-guanine dinucleotide biosynthesis protein A
MTPATGLVLAGGQGRRMGGTDKGLQPLRGRPLIAWTLERFAPQVAEVLVNANRNLGVYAGFGHRVVPDLVAGLAGPLAGLQRGLMEAAHDIVVAVPCDAPRLPADLVARLLQPLQDTGVDVAVAHAGGRLQPVFCAVRKARLPDLTAFLEDGGRKVEAWFDTLRTQPVAFADAAAFANINTPEELAALAADPAFGGK